MPEERLDRGSFLAGTAGPAGVKPDYGNPPAAPVGIEE